MVSKKQVLDEVYELREFLEADLWHAFHEEFKTERDLQKYWTGSKKK